MNIITKRETELLAPAGSMQALRAAIHSGADAVYLGGTAFNARINAKNFTKEELCEGIELAHSYGAKIYIAANTAVFDREREDLLKAAEDAYLLGADALIVADIGCALEISKRIPIELHASTQLSSHNLDAARMLADNGFSRMVCAREMSEADLRFFCANSPIEAEVFVHGALCVSTSGQCLFSSVVGGRSGNRGECAQPCRLPYTDKNGKPFYPLSLRDLSLASHVSSLLDMGVASFKIEGRMKAPEYVRDVTAVFRALIDEHRNATPFEMDELAKIFSRSGFTDGYFSKSIGKKMLGVRSENDKLQSRKVIPFEKITRKLPLSMEAQICKDLPLRIKVSAMGRSATAEGDIVQEAINAPLSPEAVKKNLSKLGATPYFLEELKLTLDENVMLPLSAINACRRNAIELLSTPNERRKEDISILPLEAPIGESREERSALFYSPSAIPGNAKEFFDRIFVPAELFSSSCGNANGVMLPEVIFDSEKDGVDAILKKARQEGAVFALVGNPGHIALAKKHGFVIYGDFRLNITNSSSASMAQRLGLEGFVLSPELTLPRLRDIGGNSSTIVYGRLPLMLTEKCIGKELGGCDDCQNGRLYLTDRKGIKFPVLRRPSHRSLVLNSLPVYMADKMSVLRQSKISSHHFIFTDETKKQAENVINAYKNNIPPAFEVRRIK